MALGLPAWPGRIRATAPNLAARPGDAQAMAPNLPARSSREPASWPGVAHARQLASGPGCGSVYTAAASASRSFCERDGTWSRPHPPQRTMGTSRWRV